MGIPENFSALKESWSTFKDIVDSNLTKAAWPLLAVAAGVREELQTAALRNYNADGGIPQELQHRFVDLWGREQAIFAILKTEAGYHNSSVLNGLTPSICFGLKEQLLELLKLSGELGCLKIATTPLEAALAALSRIAPKSKELGNLIDKALS